MGERAEPMQWVLARHRQNSGEQQLPDEETGNLTASARELCVVVQAGQCDPASRSMFQIRHIC